MIDKKLISEELQKIEQGKLDVSTSTYIKAKHTDTYVLKDYKYNLIDSLKDDSLLANIFKNKRESRMDHERSEDALTWNVFRYMDKNAILQEFILYISGGKDSSKVLRIVYWSSYEKDGESTEYESLIEARKYFKEVNKHGTEPDIIIETENCLYIIEAKFTSSNKSTINDETKLQEIEERYVQRNLDFYNTLFVSKPKSEIVKEGYYELMRNWLLGNYMASKIFSKPKHFYLINLVLKNCQKSIESDFGQYINMNNDSCDSKLRIFNRVTWEDIYSNVLAKNKDKEIMEYFNNKTKGFKFDNGEVKFKQAFNLPKVTL